MKAYEQMIFDLSQPGNSGLENFFISGSNELVVEVIKNWKIWPEKRLILLGESGSGKSHLVDFWARESNGRTVSIFDIYDDNMIDFSQNKALIIEDIDELKAYKTVKKEIIEEKLFHLINATAHASCYLMITSSSPVLSWKIKLPDLLSRLMSMTIAELLPPDDQLLMAILLKQFDDRQIIVTPEFIVFVSKRINRTYESISNFVDAIDQLTLKHKRDITIPIAREILDSLHKNHIGVLKNNSLDSSVEGER